MAASKQDELTAELKSTAVSALLRVNTVHVDTIRRGYRALKILSTNRICGFTNDLFRNILLYSVYTILRSWWTLRVFICSLFCPLVKSPHHTILYLVQGTHHT